MATSCVRGEGSGPHRRQTGSRAHGVTVSPDGRHVLVTDLGADRTFIHRFDRSTGQVLPGTGLALPPGRGPRRAVFHPSGRYVHVLHELSAEVSTWRRRPSASRVGAAPARSWWRAAACARWPAGPATAWACPSGCPKARPWSTRSSPGAAGSRISRSTAGTLRASTATPRRVAGLLQGRLDGADRQGRRRLGGRDACRRQPARARLQRGAAVGAGHGPGQARPGGRHLNAAFRATRPTAARWSSALPMPMRTAPRWAGWRCSTPRRGGSTRSPAATTTCRSGRLTGHPARDGHAAWTPDGKQIVYNSGQAGCRNEACHYGNTFQPCGQLFVMNADGSGKRQITDNIWEDSTHAVRAARPELRCCAPALLPAPWPHALRRLQGPQPRPARTGSACGGVPYDGEDGVYVGLRRGPAVWVVCGCW